jgi:hypothetical protein
MPAVKAKMSYAKILGLFVVAAVGLMAIAAIASATKLTSPIGTVATPTIKAESEGYVVLDKEPADIECTSTIEGKGESHGPAVTASGKISSLSFTGCKDSWHVEVFSSGTLEVHWSSGYNGTITSTGLTVQATRLGVICRYVTNHTQVETVTGGSPATVHLQAALPFHSGNQLCGTGPAPLTGSYQVSSPSSLFVDEEPPRVPGTIITSPTGTVATPTIKAESEGHASLHNPIAKIECAVGLEGKVESHGGEAAASGKLSSFAFTGCTNSWHVTTVAPGELAIEWAKGYNGKVISSGMTIEATRFGITCRYKTENTQLGTITGGSPATLDLEAAIPFHSGSGLCGSSVTTWTGSYKFTSPGSLYVDEAPLEVGMTSPTGTTATPAIKAESEGHVSLDHPIAKLQCQWAFEGSVKSHGKGEGAVVPLTSLSTTGCTDSWHVTTTTAGELKITSAGGYNGTVTWNGGTVEMTRLGTTCRYKTEHTHLGTLTGGSPATIDIEGKLPFHSGSPLCGEEAYPLTGSFKLTSPGSLYVDSAT